MNDESKRIERRQYASEFKTEAIKLVLEPGYTCQQAGDQLGVPFKTLSNWVRPHRQQRRRSQIDAGVANNDPAALQARIVDLQKQLRRVEMASVVSAVERSGTF